MYVRHSSLTLMKLQFCPDSRNIRKYQIGRDSSISTANCYGQGGPEIESQRRWDFPHPSGPALGSTQPPTQWVSPVGNAAGVWSWPSNPYSAKVKERVELYLYFPSGPSSPVLERTLGKYEILWKSVQWEPGSSMRTGGQTDMTELIVTFHKFANVPEYNSVSTKRRSSAWWHTKPPLIVVLR
jgi:hypothetical protein